MRRVGILVAAAVLPVVVASAGCENAAPEPPRYTTIENEAAAIEPEERVGEVFSRVVATAREAVGGDELREGDSVRSRECDELYPSRFQELEIGGSFLVQDSTPDDVAEQVLTAWGAEGWEARATDPDRLSLQTRVADGVRVIASATIREGSNPGVVTVQMRAGTGCLELPESVVDAG